jgi:hypothetical protein
MSVWARERYEWDDQAMEMRATERLGVLGRIMNAVAPRMLSKRVPKRPRQDLRRNRGAALDATVTALPGG